MLKTEESVVGKTRAGRNGQKFEDTICEILEIHFDFEVFKEKEFQKLKHEEHPDRHVRKNVPHEGLVSHLDKMKNLKRNRGPRTEFVIFAKDAKYTPEFPLVEGEPLEIRIECKWQEVSGTTKEKLMHTVSNLRYCGEPNVLIIMDGGAFGPYESLVENLIKDPPYFPFLPEPEPKIMAKMNLAEFRNWAQRALG